MQCTLELTLMFPWPHLAVYATPPGTNDIGEQFAKNKSMTAAETGAATAARLAMLVNLTLQASHWCFVCRQAIGVLFAGSVTACHLPWLRLGSAYVDETIFICLAGN